MAIPQSDKPTFLPAFVGYHGSLSETRNDTAAESSINQFLQRRTSTVLSLMISRDFQRYFFSASENREETLIIRLHLSNVERELTFDLQHFAKFTDFVQIIQKLVCRPFRRTSLCFALRAPIQGFTAA